MSEPRPSSEDLDALFARARMDRADTSRAQYTFETRLLAGLRSPAPPATSLLFGRMSWRLAPFFAMAVLALAVWNADNAADSSDDIGLRQLQHPETADLISGDI